MKKLLLLTLALCGAALLAAETTAPTPAAAPATEELKPLNDWVPLQFGFLPDLPPSTWNSNVYGLKSGWPICNGIGRCYGLEISWLYSGTENVRGIQVSWVTCYTKVMEGVQATWVTSLNSGIFRGLQGTVGYAQAGDLQGAQGAVVTLADKVAGVQAGAVTIADEVRGFQAGGVALVSGKLTGVQCNLYGQVGDSCGLQLGVVNVSKGKGLQFGAINIMKDGFLPVFPIFNFGW